MYIQRKRLFFGNIRGILQIELCLWRAQSKTAQHTAQHYLSFSKFVQQNLTFSKLCNRFLFVTVTSSSYPQHHRTSIYSSLS